MNELELDKEVELIQSLRNLMEIFKGKILEAVLVSRGTTMSTGRGMVL